MPFLPVRALLRVPPPPEEVENKILEHADHYNIDGFEFKKGAWKIIPYGLNYKDIISELTELIYVMVQGLSISLRFVGPSDDLSKRDGLMDLIASTLRCIPSTRRIKTKKTRDMITCKIKCTSAYNGIISEGEIVVAGEEKDSENFDVTFYICTCTKKSYDEVQKALEKTIGKENEELKGYKLSLEPYSLLDSLLVKGDYSLLKTQETKPNEKQKKKELILNKSTNEKENVSSEVNEEQQQQQKGSLAYLLNLAKEREKYVTNAKNEAHSKITNSQSVKSVHPLTRLLQVEKFVQENKFGERHQDIQQVFLSMVGLYGLIINSLKAADQAKAIEAFQLDVASKIEEKIKKLREEEGGQEGEGEGEENKEKDKDNNTDNDDEMKQNAFKSVHVYSGPFRAITEMAMDVSRMKTQKTSFQKHENNGKEPDSPSDDTDDEIENDSLSSVIHRLQTATPTKVPSTGLPPSRYAYYSFIRGAGYDRDELLKELRNISSSSSLFLDKLLNDTTYKPKYVRNKTSEERKYCNDEEKNNTTQATEMFDCFSEERNNVNIDNRKVIKSEDHYSEIQKQQQRNKLRYLSVLRLSPLAQLRNSKPSLEKVLNDQEKLIMEQKVQMKATQLAMNASSSATEEILGVLDSQNALYRGLLESARRVLVRTKDAALSVAERVVTCNKTSPSPTTSPISFMNMDGEEDNYRDEFLEDFNNDELAGNVINPNNNINNNNSNLVSKMKSGSDSRTDSTKSQLLGVNAKLGSISSRIKRGYFSSKSEVTLNRPLSPSASIKTTVENSYNSPIDSFSDEESASSRSPSPPQTSQYYNSVLVTQNSVLDESSITKNEGDTNILSFKSLDNVLKSFEDVETTRAKYYADIAAKKVKFARARESGRTEAMVEDINELDFGDAQTQKETDTKMYNNNNNNNQNNSKDGSFDFTFFTSQNSSITETKKDGDELPFGDVEGYNAKWRENICRDATIGISSLYKQVEDEIYKLEKMMTRLSLRPTRESTPKVAGRRGKFSQM